MRKNQGVPFARGFARGFSSPYTAVFSKPRRYNKYGRGAVALSWAIVGGLLNSATAIEAKNIEQATQEKSTKSTSRISA